MANRALPLVPVARKVDIMATRRIPIKITTRVTTRATMQRQVRVQHQSRTYSQASFSAWQGSIPGNVTNNYGDVNTISGEGRQVAIGVQGSVVQISSPLPVDAEALATASRQLLDLIDQIPLPVDDIERLRADADEVIDEAGESHPDQDLLRSRGRSMLGLLGTVSTAAAGGIIAQLISRALLAALG